MDAEDLGHGRVKDEMREQDGDEENRGGADKVEGGGDVVVVGGTDVKRGGSGGGGGERVKDGENDGDDCGEELCVICFVSVAKSEMYSLSRCKHRFCMACQQQYWTNKVFSGQLDSMFCMSGASCAVRPTEHDLQTILDERTYRKLQYFRAKKHLRHRSDIIFCPAELCWRPILINSAHAGTCNDGGGGGFVDCGACGSRVCVACELQVPRTDDDDGGVHECAVLRKASMMSERRRLGLRMKRKGKSVLKKLGIVRSCEEEREQQREEGAAARDSWRERVGNGAWVVLHTKRCPACKVRIQKNAGCSHMSCSACGADFCWRCRGLLSTYSTHAQYLQQQQQRRRNQNERHDYDEHGDNHDDDDDDADNNNDDDAAADVNDYSARYATLADLQGADYDSGVGVGCC
eukprot:CAMPEP_0185858096 /NCGR_PEP_ID=MMETSP1354-20130828/29840_1 /TAXON_ID=708628 /ORGANISM="Erythrolobus madagascarensis, Strain CCMP3276" /LENGTH=404 /DNA_ID=CAMNT_0028560375 /DNA_START=9 /DNA_END=1220 /DNA_ORIENTATION=-